MQDINKSDTRDCKKCTHSSNTDECISCTHDDSNFELKEENIAAFPDMPDMTREEQFAIRSWLALGHQENKCHVYADDGELQCNNMQRHGRCIDFRREKISDLMAILQATILLESGKIQGITKDTKPTDIVAMWKKSRR
jgi:hypothetical protein